MTQRKFKKIVKVDIKELRYTLFFGLTSILFPFLLLLENEITFLKIVFNAVFDGILFYAFVTFIINYLGKRKVYWVEEK